MAAVVSLTCMAALLVVGGPAPQVHGSPGLPPNVFMEAPSSPRYPVWWRPLKVIFDGEKVLRIQERVAEKSVEHLKSADLSELFEEDRDSAFVFPVLATQGESGRVLLARYLGEYSNGVRLDDRWLLIVAALGHNRDPQSRALLERELERLEREYDFSDWARVADVRVPVVDALFASMARDRVLSAEVIERLSTKLLPHDGVGWMRGLEWAQALMDEDGLFSVLQGLLDGCSDEDLLRASNFQGASSRLLPIRDFLASPEDAFVLARGALLHGIAWRRPCFE